VKKWNVCSFAPSPFTQSPPLIFFFEISSQFFLPFRASLCDTPPRTNRTRPRTELLFDR
jgi:hypothetical protein